MRSVRVALSLLFSLCACAFSVAASPLQLQRVGGLKNVNNNEDSQPLPGQSPHDFSNFNSKGNVILSVTREPEEVTDVYSLEDSEHDTADDEQTEQDDVPIIIYSEPIQEEGTGTVFNSSESPEKHNATHLELQPQTFEPVSSAEILKRLDVMTTQIKTQEVMINELKNNNRHLEDKFNRIDHKTKMNNVIFMNIRESKHENYKSLLQKVIQILNRMMRLRVSADDIVTANRINGRNTDLFRPVVVTFTNFATKLKVLAARNKLKRSKFDMLDDYSELVNKTRRLLLPFLFENRRQGHKVSMVQDRLIINGVKKSLSDLRQENSKKTQEEKGFKDQHSQEKLKAEKKENGALDE